MDNVNNNTDNGMYNYYSSIEKPTGIFKVLGLNINNQRDRLTKIYGIKTRETFFR